MTIICDKEHKYYPNQQSQKLLLPNIHRREQQTKDEVDLNVGFKPKKNAKLDRLRQIEIDKLKRIENELDGSYPDLRVVRNAQDSDEFEDYTNQQFNINFEAEWRKSGSRVDSLLRASKNRTIQY